MEKVWQSSKQELEFQEKCDPPVTGGPPLRGLKAYWRQDSTLPKMAQGANPVRHYGHLVAAQHSASGLHVRAGSGLALGFTKSPMIRLAMARQFSLSPALAELFFHFFYGSEVTWNGRLATKTHLYPSAAKYKDSTCIQAHTRQALGIFSKPRLKCQLAIHCHLDSGLSSEGTDSDIN